MTWVKPVVSKVLGDLNFNWFCKKPLEKIKPLGSDSIMDLSRKQVFRVLGIAGFCALAGFAWPQQPDNEEKAQRIEQTIAAWHQAGLFQGVALVASEGEILWSGGAGLAIREWDIPHQIDGKFPIASLSKTFTAILIMRRVQNNELELDATISQYLPWYPEDIGAQVTLWHLLSHTSGLRENSDGLYVDPLAEGKSLRWIIETHAGGPLRFEPGTDFNYTNIDYLTLGAILEEITGERFAVLLMREILMPLEMSDSGIARQQGTWEKRVRDYIPQGADRWERAPAFFWQNWRSAGGMYSTVLDLHRWNIALTTNELISPATWSAMLQPYANGFPSGGNGVALGFWVYPRPLEGTAVTPTLIERRGAIGGFRTTNIILKDENSWVILLSNASSETVHQIPWENNLPLDLVRVLRDLPSQGPPKPKLGNTKASLEKDRPTKKRGTRSIKELAPR
jgi:CubicO group peptidase (beta-lactamase class C family)